MAGYVFLLNDINNLAQRIDSGTYSTIINNPSSNYWSTAIESTVGDYLTMNQGDNIYFFSKRKIYGIGELTRIHDFVFLQNFPDAIQPNEYQYEDVVDDLLFNFGEESFKNRLICFFRPAPHFFRDGVDMDDVLMSDPSKFKMLRFIQNVSFIKVDDEENQALKNIILKRNIEAVVNPNEANTHNSGFENIHEEINQRITNNHSLNLSELLNPFVHEGKLRHEMLVEIAILDQIQNSDHETIELFGQWDYLSHQVAASPFKPVAYIDKIDIFGFKYLENLYPTIEKYLVIEVKKGEATIEDVAQLMKYIDWVKNEYSSGDYSLIRSFLVANSFNQNINQSIDEIILRNFIYGSRPSIPKTWNDVTLVSYNYNQDIGKLNFAIHEIAIQ
ncbi:MAG: hypothetical protein JST87_16745 [Bacteroidetes bacterium]|nr:hypothetical protein [Bacteroidota bacterium]